MVIMDCCTAHLTTRMCMAHARIGEGKAPLKCTSWAFGNALMRSSTFNCTRGLGWVILHSLLKGHKTSFCNYEGHFILLDVGSIILQCITDSPPCCNSSVCPSFFLSKIVVSLSFLTIEINDIGSIKCVLLPNRKMFFRI